MKLSAKFFWFGCLAILLACGSVFQFSPTPVWAATVDNLTDQPSSLQVSTASNHKFTFTLVDDWAEGETITFTFASGFDTSTISFTDIDITDDGVDLSIAATCSGSDQASAAMAGDVLTLTICAGDGGAVATSSVVTVEVGANAAFGANGSNRITNPATVATHYIALGGTSGNDGSIPLPIGATSGAGVSTSITGGSSGESGDDGEGGGGGGGGGSDSDPDPQDPPDDPQDPPVDPQDPPVDPGEDPVDPQDPPDEDPIDEPDPGQDPVDPTPDVEEDPETQEPDGGSAGEVEIEVEIFATPDLQLDVTQGEIEVLPNVSAIIVVEVTGPGVPSAVIVVIGDTEYVLAPQDDGTFSGSIPAPANDDILSTVVIFEDGSRSSETVVLDVQGPGSVYELIGGERVLVGGSVVTVYRLDGATEIAWDATDYRQTNPLVTPTGYFSWYVPNGTYVVYATKAGYTEASVAVRVTNNILIADLELVPLPIEPVVPPEPGEGGALTRLKAWLKSPEAQTVADIALPLAAALAVGTLTVLLLGFNLLPYLQYFFTSPFLFFGRRKRQAYGVVYNAITKVPVELAIVRLYRLPDNKLVKTVVTSPDGRYSMAVDPGQYRLEVIKPGFVFPSQYLAGQRADGKYLDVYSGQELKVTDQDALIAANVPLDPLDAGAFHEPRILALKRFARSLQMVTAPIGVLLSVVVYVISPSILAGIMVIVQLVVMILVLRLARPKRPQGWGIVYDEVTHQPVGNAVIRIFEPKYNKLVETALSDSLGRYSFLLGPNEYFVSYNKPGYSEKIVRPIDYTDKPEPTPLAMNVALQHVSGEQHVSAR